MLSFPGASIGLSVKWESCRVIIRQNGLRVKNSFPPLLPFLPSFHFIQLFLRFSELEISGLAGLPESLVSGTDAAGHGLLFRND